MELPGSGPKGPNLFPGLVAFWTLLFGAFNVSAPELPGICSTPVGHGPSLAPSITALVEACNQRARLHGFDGYPLGFLYQQGPATLLLIFLSVIVLLAIIAFVLGTARKSSRR